MIETQALLAEFARSRSETAFRELVDRYLNLVYATALRLVGGDAHLAQDVAQSVFLHLAQKAHTLRPDSTLGGWLHRDTCHVAATLMRGERRRQNRERLAVAMNSLPDHSEANLAQLAPVLDDAINQLRAEDRAAILLRFYEQRDLRSVGAALGSSENAAQKRIARALEELRSLLQHRGVALSAAALAATLTAQSSTAAPAGLAATISTSVLTNAASASTPALTLLKLMAATNFKTAAVGALIVASVLTPLFLRDQARARLQDQDDALRRQSAQLTQLAADNNRLASLLAQTNDSRPADPQLNDLLKLRSEVGRLKHRVNELSSSAATPVSPEEQLAYLKSKYATQVTRLKDWLDAHPNEKIPELARLSDDYWTDGVETLDKDDDLARAMSSLRRSAEDKVFYDLRTALKSFVSNNVGQFPADLSQLKPYFNQPVDDAILQRYEIVPANTLVPELRSPECAWAITQKSPVNPELDDRAAFGLDLRGRIQVRHADSTITNRWNPSH